MLAHADKPTLDDLIDFNVTYHAIMDLFDACLFFNTSIPCPEAPRLMFPEWLHVLHFFFFV